MKKNVICIFTLLMLWIYVVVEIVSGVSLSPKGATIIAIIASAVAVACFWTNCKLSMIGMTSVIMLYTILTQFGLVAIYYILGETYLQNYTSYTLRFLKSGQLSEAILLGTIAIITYAIAANVELTQQRIVMPFRRNVAENLSDNKGIVNIGYAFLIIVFLFYCFYLAIGAFKVGGSYSEFRDNVISTSNIYAYILMLYSMGIVFVIAAGDKKQIKIGIILYCLSAFILLMTGNKGEVFYSVLACIGVAKYRDFKVDKKIILLMCAIVFVIIPFVTANRETGISNSINNVSLNFTDAFTEMGMQIRVSVYVLDEMVRGTRNLMFGYSYYAPVINIISKIVPFIGLRLVTPSDYNFLTKYAGMGFSQVAESYCNFGIVGIIIFFFVIGKMMAKKERSKLNRYQLAFWGCITSILINAARNRFAFVLGQALIIYIVITVIELYDRHRGGGYNASSANC